MNLDRKYNWISLESENPGIIKNIISEWETLIEKELPEKDYHEFLKEHAGFFFSDYNCYLTISKLKLSSELETDFINIKDQRSNGLIYEFIEIEKPQSKLFNSNGLPAKDFNSAIQQIRDWKRFLIENKSWFKKYLPTYSTRIISDSCIKFSIIIGRRTYNESEIEKRNQIASELGIEIRSFDYLTDLLRKRKFYNQGCLDSEKGEIIENQIENPFSKAITDSEWRKFCSRKFNWTHFYKNNCEEIVKLRKYNNLIKEMN
ncbi:MAG: DUF4263 domain-containing protein [Flavobacteriales bacterium]|nr:DUF4263 domain-containing protein [Flavobacteriales bacterium]